MKDKKEMRCPGCSERCPMSAPGCSFGRKYFAKKAGKGRCDTQKMHKWERNISSGGTVWKLVSVGKAVKKALRSKELSEEELLKQLSEDEIRILNGALDKIKKNLE